MDGVDFGLVALSALIVLGGVICVLLISLAVRRAVYIRSFGYSGPHRNQQFARLSLFAIFIGLFFAIVFVVGGGPNGSHTSNLLGGWFELIEASALIAIGVIITALIKIPRPRKDESLSTRIVQHAYVAWPWRHKWVFLIGFIICLISGIFVYQKLALRQNREAFAQARSAIDTVYANIVTKVGSPDNSRRTNTCSRPSREFEQGPLSCDVSTDFIYGVRDQAAANEIIHQIQDVFSSNRGLFIPSTAPPSDIVVTPAPGNYSDSSIDYYRTKDGLGCSIRYLYDHPSETFLLLKGNNKKSLYITSACSDYARSEYYPIDQID